jgi:hypothetical protein
MIAPDRTVQLGGIDLMRFARLVALLAGALTAFGFQTPASVNLGTVAGRVIEVPSSESDKGIRKALVILKRGQEPGIGVYSDDKGNYRLQAEPGAYSVTVERLGYVVSSQSQPKTIVVQGRQTLSDVNLELVRTGVISGRVVDPDGDPMPQVSVQLRSTRERKPRSLGAVTDDRGVYRIFQIPPGKYYLSAVYQPAFQVREIQMQASDGALEESYGTTYYPGTFDFTQARSIDVPVGADLPGLDLQLQRMHAVHIRGRIIGIAGPLPVVIMLQPQGSGFGTMRDLPVRNRNGEFDLSGIPPGKYELSASAFDLTNRGAGPSAHQNIEVGQTDVEGIELTLVAPQAITGLVVVPESRKIPQRLLVMLLNRARTNGQDGGLGLGQVAPDGAFTLDTVPAGDYDVAVGSTGPGDDLYVSAVRRGGEDVLAHGLHVNGSSNEAIEIALKANGGMVKVVARTPKGEPFPEANVTLLPDQPRREQVALYGNCVTDARGTCTLHGITPGEYHALAVSKDSGIDFRDPNITKEFEKQTKAVKVAEGDLQSVEIEVVRDGE